MAYSEFKGEIWSAALLANFRKSLTAYGLATTDYEGDFMQGATKVHVIAPAAGSVNSYVPASGITWEEVTSPTIELTLTEQKYVAIKVEDVDQAQSNFKVMDALVAPSGQALAQAVDASIYGLANGFSTGAGDVTLDLSNTASLPSVYGALLEAGENLDKQDAPRDGRFVVASPRFLRAALADKDFISVGSVADAARVEGSVGRVAGFDVVPSNNAYSVGNGTSADKVEHLFYGVRGSFAAALRLNGAPEAVRLPNHFATGVRMLTLYGAKIVRDKGLGLVKATVIKKP